MATSKKNTAAKKASSSKAPSKGQSTGKKGPGRPKKNPSAASPKKKAAPKAVAKPKKVNKTSASSQGADIWVDLGPAPKPQVMETASLIEALDTAVTASVDNAADKVKTGILSRIRSWLRS